MNVARGRYTPLIKSTGIEMDVPVSVEGWMFTEASPNADVDICIYLYYTKFEKRIYLTQDLLIW